MKRPLFSICLLLGIVSIAQAHPQPPITCYIQSSSTVCIAKVTAVKDGVVTFTVEEIIKGKPPAVLILRIAEVPVEITQNSEWLLALARTNENTVGWAMDGDDGWVNAPIKRVDGKPFLVGNYGYVEPKVETDVSKGMSLDQLKELAKEPPTKDLRSISLPIPH